MILFKSGWEWKKMDFGLNQPIRLTSMVQTYVGVFVADCHNHSKEPEKYRGKGKAGAPFRTSSNWFLASTNPHNPLVDEWLAVYVNHLLTLPDPTTPYFLAHCALTQARMNNQTVDNIWASGLNVSYQGIIGDKSK